MGMPTLGNPQNTIEILKKYQFSFQKKFGQNFLIDTHVLDKIIRAADIGKDDMVLEIGPGIGTMTQYLAEAAGKVVAVEIDRNLIPILQDTLDGYENVRLINEDVLKLDLRKLVQEENEGKPVKVVANLPYYITTPIIMGLFESHSTGLYFLLLFAFNGFTLLSICRWTLQWQDLRQGAQAIVKGNPELRIDTAGMKLFPDLRAHAEALNDLGSAINTAVDARLRSERMKAELITNVSHDLKTPLTSIINYVDLLKKEDIQGEKAQEYIEVLDRKSQRLKKLTEDLVEASKASTGTLTVNAERLGMGQLVDQALGEYNAKFEAANLTLLSTLPPQELYVKADGRHVWRILDNLLGNCVKYAMPGTRVYLELLKWDGNVIFSLKNVSASQLNVPPEELMERFVRGDESRTTEGSGLGLSIARSLTEVQGGSFRLSIDGDLFKASVSFPEVE